MKPFHNDYLFSSFKIKTVFLLLFLVKDPNRESIKIIMKGFLQKIIKVMLDNGILWLFKAFPISFNIENQAFYKHIAN
jgi:hypothetical protein